MSFFFHEFIKFFFEFRYIFSIHNVLSQVLLVNYVMSVDIVPFVHLEAGTFWFHLISSRFYIERNSYFLFTLSRPLLILLISSICLLSAFHNKNLHLFYCSSSCNISLPYLLHLSVSFTVLLYLSEDGYVTINTVEDVDVSCIYTTEKLHFMFLIPFVVISSIVCLHFTFLHSEFLLPSHYMVEGSSVSLQSVYIILTNSVSSANFFVSFQHCFLVTCDLC